MNILQSQFYEFQYDILMFPLLNLALGSFKVFYRGYKCPSVTATHIFFYDICTFG